MRAVASISARWENACGKFPRCLAVFGSYPRHRGRGARRSATDAPSGRGLVASPHNRECRTSQNEQITNVPSLPESPSSVSSVRNAGRSRSQSAPRRQRERFSAGACRHARETRTTRQQRRGVECVRLVVLAQHASVADPVSHHIRMDLVRRCAPCRRYFWIASDLSQCARAVQGDPAHQLGGNVVLWLAASLPDALVGTRQMRVAHAACDLTIGQSLRGKRSFRRVWSRIEFRTAPNTSFCR